MGTRIRDMFWASGCARPLHPDLVAPAAVIASMFHHGLCVLLVFIITLKVTQGDARISVTAPTNAFMFGRLCMIGVFVHTEAWYMILSFLYHLCIQFCNCFPCIFETCIIYAPILSLIDFPCIFLCVFLWSGSSFVVTLFFNEWAMTRVYSIRITLVSQNNRWHLLC